MSSLKKRLVCQLPLQNSTVLAFSCPPCPRRPRCGMSASTLSSVSDAVLFYMENGEPYATAEITPALTKLNLKPSAGAIPSFSSSSSSASSSALSRIRPRKLVSLCLGVLGKHFDDILVHLTEISVILPTNIKMAMSALARRKKLLDDDVLNALLDDSWDILDISGSDVTDHGLTKAAQICPNLRAIDISKCNKITVQGVSEIISKCHLLEILRCGGCTRSEITARRCLSIFAPKLNAVEEESWEDLDNTNIVDGALSLRWLVWPNIDPESKERLATECPRIVVNPQPSPLSLRGTEVPIGALPGTALDEPCIEDIDPKARAVSYAARVNILPVVSNSSPELSMAEKFRLAFVERDLRLAPKRAKNVRQHQRRAEREWAMSSADAKSIIFASKYRQSLQNRI